MKRRRKIIGASLLCGILFVAASITFSRMSREQRAVIALQKVGATIDFDFQSAGHDKPPMVPEWLRLVVGDCLFADVENVRFYGESSTTDGSVLPLADLPSLRAVALHGPGITDATAKLLSNIPSLQSVNLRDTSVTGAGLKQMAACTQLESLTLMGNTITDETIHGIQQWSALKYIQIVRASISSDALLSVAAIRTLRGIDLWEAGSFDDEGMVHLEALESLESLYVINASITDIGMKSCAAWRSLKFMRINSPQITDSGVKHLEFLASLEEVGFQDTAIQNPGVFARLPRLRTLDLSGTQITDTTVEQLAKSSSIESLSVHRTRLTDQSLKYLGSLTTLRKLMVGPLVTESAARELHDTLPQCTINGIDDTGSYLFTVWQNSELNTTR